MFCNYKMLFGESQSITHNHKTDKGPGESQVRVITKETGSGKTFLASYKGRSKKSSLDSGQKSQNKNCHTLAR